MNATGWLHLWTEATALCAQEPPPIQLALLLAVAFAALMVLEGLRASFLPQRKEHAPIAASDSTTAKDPVAPPPQARTLPAQSAITKFGAAQHHYAPARTSIGPKRKIAHIMLNKERAARPIIRRRANATVTEP